MKKSLKTILITAGSVLLLLSAVLVFFSCAVDPTPEKETKGQDWKTVLGNSSWTIRDGRKLESSQVPDYLKNCAKISFSAEKDKKYSCTLSDGQSDFSTCFFTFTTEEDGTLFVFDLVSEDYKEFRVHLSYANKEYNMRIKYSDQDFADFCRF